MLASLGMRTPWLFFKRVWLYCLPNCRTPHRVSRHGCVSRSTSTWLAHLLVANMVECDPLEHHGAHPIIAHPVTIKWWDGGLSIRRRASRAAFQTLIRKRPEESLATYVKPVKHPFLPYGELCTLIHDESSPFIQRVVGYEQICHAIYGVAPDYCLEEYVGSNEQYSTDFDFASRREGHAREILRRHDSQMPTTEAEPCDALDCVSALLLSETRVASLAAGDGGNLGGTASFVRAIAGFTPSPCKHKLLASDSECHDTLGEQASSLVDLIPLLGDDSYQPSDFQLTIMAARIPSDATPIDAIDDPPRTAEEIISSIPDEQLPKDPKKAQDVREILLRNRETFSLYKFDIGNIDPEKYGYFEIETGDSPPHWEQQRRRSHTEREALHMRVLEYRAADVVQPANGEWACNPLLVPKKDGDYRLCIDLRGLNRVTRKSRYPLPRTEELVASVRGCDYITTLDLKSAYNAIQIKPEDREKTAFYAGDYGLQCFKRLAMGLSNAPAFFQQFIEELLSDMRTQGQLPKGEKLPFVKVFLDDVCIFSRTWEDHIQHIDMVLKRLAEVGLKISTSKCYYGQPEVLYLGFYISGTGTRPDPKSVSCIEEYPRPTTVKQVQSFLGACNFFRHYIKDFAKIAVPLYALTKIPSTKRRPTDLHSNWNEKHNRAFETLKKALISAPVLSQPDFSKPFYLHTDASGEAIGAVLTQNDEDGNPQAIGFASRVLSDVERRYSATEGECLAVMFGVESFRWALHGNQFHLYSDHQALQFLMGGGAARSNNRKHHRWLAELQSYNFTIEHKPGVDNLVPDALSRCYAASVSDRLNILVSALRTSLQGMDFVGHHRANSQCGFKLSTDKDGIPLATPETLASCLTVPFAPPPEYETISREAHTRFGGQVHIATDGGEEILELLSSYVSISPKMENTSNSVAVVPDPTTLRNTSHEDWIRLLPHFTTMGVISSSTSTTAPHLVLSKRQSPPLSQPSSMPVIDHSTVMLRTTKALHVMEACGGLCVFLEALLRNGFTIHRYSYVDNDRVARSAALHRLWRLHYRYPRQLPVSAFRQFTLLPQDVHHIERRHLEALPPVDLFAAGPPCQAFSSAGPQLGWKASGAQVFPATLRLLHVLQDLQPRDPPSYIIENVPASRNYSCLIDALGNPVTGDAIFHGSAAHRDTLFWTNMAPLRVLQESLDTPSVSQPWTMRQFLLDLGLERKFLMHEGNTEHFGKFVRSLHSYAHRIDGHGNPGRSQLIFEGRPIELPPSLRELAMGFNLGDTRPPNISEKEHHELLGNCIDINLATHLVKSAITTTGNCCGACVVADQCQFDGLCECLRCSLFHDVGRSTVNVGATAAERRSIQAIKDTGCRICHDTNGEDNMVICNGCDGYFHLRCLSPPRSTAPSGDFYCPACDPSGATTLQELYNATTPLDYDDKDPYMDIHLLDFISMDEAPIGLSTSEMKAFIRRANRYRRHPTHADWLQYKHGRRPWRTIPPKEYRLDLIRVFHDAAGHAGARTTSQHLGEFFTWIGIERDVANYVRDCDSCQRRRAPVLMKEPHPFDLYGAFEHVLMDSCGPFELPEEWDHPSSSRAKSGKTKTSESRKAWIIIMVDYFTKVAEFAVVLDHSSETAASAFYDHWLARYPKPIKVTTDNGTEFMDAMHSLLGKLNINHVTTATFNPTANGAAERLVGNLKNMLSRMIGDHQTGWLQVLPHVRSAYMRKIHRATGFSPIHMLTGKPDALLLPLADLLPDVNFMPSYKSWSGHSHLIDAALCTRTDIDVLSLRDYSFALQFPGLIHIAEEDSSPCSYAPELKTVFIARELDELDRSLLSNYVTFTSHAAHRYMSDLDVSRQGV